MSFSCPSCGAEVVIKNKSSLFTVCKFCSSTLMRNDQDIELLGKMAALPQDMSVFQIGTQGFFNNKSFEIIGRQKWRWENGIWNEWYVLFQNLEAAWLAEAQGNLMMSFQVKLDFKIPKLTELKVGSQLYLGNEQYIVNDIKNVSCQGSEGELPVLSPIGRRSTSIDLINSKKQFANIDYGEQEIRIFIGKYVEFEELKLKNLRVLDGW